MTRRFGWIGGVTVAVLVSAVPASAGAATGGYLQENLVSDQPGAAQLTDPQLVNAWGMSRGPNTPVWVSDNGADVTTLYNGAVRAAPRPGRSSTTPARSCCPAPPRRRGSSSSASTATCRRGPVARPRLWS